MNPPANWYPDPTGRHGQRYWDGETWTEHVFTDGVQAVDPLEDGTDDGVGAGDDGTDTTAHETTPDDGGTSAASPLFVDAGGAQTDAVGATSQTDDADDTDDQTGRWSPEDQRDDDRGATTVLEGDEDAGGAEHPGSEQPVAGVEDAAEGTGETVAPEVQADDVVASLDEVTEASDALLPMASSDLSDAFVLAPETVSRLVRRQGGDEPAEATDATDHAPDEDASPTGAIDAPPPVVDAPAPAAAGGPGGLGITGELVGGAFAEREQAGPVALQNTRLLRCTVSAGSGVIARQGTMVAYQGNVSFDRQGAGGVARALKRAATGEGLAMMQVEGSGDVFFADGAQHVFLLHLDGGPGLSVNGRNVLAFSSSLQWDIERVKGATLLAGGLFNTTLTGTGWVALVSDGEPVVLRTDEAPTYVDVNALVAWSAGLSTRVVNTVSAKSLVGLGSGEAFQMAFDGAGVVIVQPSEGVTPVATSS